LPRLHHSVPPGKIFRLRHLTFGYSLDIRKKLDFAGVVTGLVQTTKWQRVEQFVEPVVGRVVDVRVLTQVVAQRRFVGNVVGLEIGRTVQHHQHDQTILAL